MNVTYAYVVGREVVCELRNEAVFCLVIIEADVDRDLRTEAEEELTI